MDSSEFQIAFDLKRDQTKSAEEASRRDRQGLHRLMGLEEAHG